MSFLDRYPVLKKAVANQYQAILVAGAVGFSALTLSPLPLVALAGLELMAMPFLLERLKRRLDIEKKHAERQHQAMSQEQRFEALSPNARNRFVRLRQLCQKIQANYRGLSQASQNIIADQESKFDVILASCLHRLWLVQKYDEMIGGFNEKQEQGEIERVKEALAAQGLEPRVRDALEKNLQIRERLFQSVKDNVSSRTALLAELDSLEALLQLLLQKSVAATDALAFSSEIDDVLAQSEADAASIREMEQMLGEVPEMGATDILSEKLKQAMPTPVPPPLPPQRKKEGRRF
ncbi:MAG TPA: hypothetical protein VJ885_04455 [Thermoanaerobaculia bacterium]|nr:hypothetical protein [Thermoanaerobaculia bacterium]